MYRLAMLSVHTCPLATLGGKETGGMNVYVRDLSRELGRRGFHVDVFTRSQNPDLPQVGDLGPNARVIHLKAGPEAPYDKNLVYSHLPEFAGNLRQFVARENIVYDLIHSHYWFSGVVARQLRAEWNTPVTQMFHTLGKLKNQVARSTEQRETPHRVETERQIMSLADRLIAANPLEKAQMIWLYGADPAKIEVIPCGVDVSLFHPIPRDEAKAYLEMPERHRMVLFVGRIEPLKGIDVLIEAMALVLDQMDELRNEVCLCIIGGDPDGGVDRLNQEMSRLQQMREQLGIDDVVTFLGKKAQDALPYHYSAAEVCVVPSHYESFGMVALEAMACGAPVIASKVGGLTFTVRDGQTGFLVPSDDPRALADRLRLLLADEKLRQAMGQQAIQLSQSYSWSAVASQVVATYRNLVAQFRAQVCCGDGDERSATRASCCK